MVRSSGVQSFQCSQWSQQHQPSMTRMPCSIGEVEELIGLELAFQANGVQVHIAHQAELVAQAVVDRCAAACPATSRRRESECGLPLTRNRRLPLAVNSDVISRNPKSTLCSSVTWSLAAEAHREVLQMRLAHLMRPPELGIANVQLRKLLGREDDGAVLMRRQLDRLLEAHSGSRARGHALHRVVGGVVQLGVDGQVGGVERGDRGSA